VLDVLSSGRERPKPAAQDEAKLNLLSERELEVLRLTAQGLSVSEIAAKLHRSENTVATHRRNLHRKLNLDNRVDLTRFAIRNHLADT
jgi:two-component system capsular synthesis response regulator RcsB